MTKKRSQHTRDMEKMTGVSNLQRGKPRPAEVSVRAYGMFKANTGELMGYAAPSKRQADNILASVAHEVWGEIKYVPVRIVLDKERKR